tara:strand:+ start:887 stop:1366 length:480 start_codon:yes stop_codon:yes gene_type:complete
MTKKFNIFDNTNLQDDESWGNIQLAGYTDEELHSKNWNRITGLREYFKNETVEAKQKRGASITIAKLENHPTKGIPNSPEHKEKISKALTGKKKPPRTKKHRQAMMKPCMTPDGAFESTNAATAHWGYSWAENVARKIKCGHEGWYWITREEYEKLKDE